MRRIFGVGLAAAIVAGSAFVVLAPAGAATTGTVTLFAGNGTQATSGPSGNGGAATSAEFFDPSDEAVTSSGTIYIADMKDCQVRQVSPSGEITAFAGVGECSPTVTAGGFALSGLGGPAADAVIGMPTGIAVDSSGNLYIADCMDYTGVGPGCEEGSILEVAGGTITELESPTAISDVTASDGNGGGEDAWGLRVEGGNVYFSDTVNNVVERVSTAGGTPVIVAGVPALSSAGTSSATYGGDGGPATSADLNDPTGLYVDGSGNIFIADSKNFRVREVTFSTGDITTIAGNGTAGTGSGELDKPFGVVEDGSGNVYIADYEGFCVREVTGGTMSTFAGTCGTEGYNVSSSGIPASSVLFGSKSADSPQGGPSNLVFTPSGELLINDYGDNVVDLVSFSTTTPSTPTISNLPTTALTGGSFTATVSTNSNGATSVASNTTKVCTASGLTVNFVSAGTCSLTAQVAATSTYSGATGVAQLFTVSPVTSSTTGTPTQGYWLVASDGGIFNYGTAGFYGSSGSIHLNKPIVGMAATPDKKGYWLVASDGGIFNYGDATFYGSTGSIHLNQPIVGMASTPDGKGYWLVAADGGIFSYGDAAFYGSTGSIHLNQPIVGMAASSDGKGYWLVASDGGIFNYGDAAFYGSTGAIHLNQPIVGMAASHDGKGYWLVASDGGIFNYGDAAFEGSAGAVHLNKPIVGMGTSADGGGYWLVASDGGIFNYGDAVFEGSAGGSPLNQPIVGLASNS